MNFVIYFHVSIAPRCGIRIHNVQSKHVNNSINLLLPVCLPDSHCVCVWVSASTLNCIVEIYLIVNRFRQHRTHISVWRVYIGADGSGKPYWAVSISTNDSCAPIIFDWILQNEKKKSSHYYAPEREQCFLSFRRRNSNANLNWPFTLVWRLYVSFGCSTHTM